MGSSAVDLEMPVARSVVVGEDTLRVDLSDGRAISVPLEWYPRLLHATRKERADWRLVAKGRGIRWESIDEDISVDGVLAGRPSSESQKSLKEWLKSRPRRFSTRSTVSKKR